MKVDASELLEACSRLELRTIRAVVNDSLKEGPPEELAKVTDNVGHNCLHFVAASCQFEADDRHLQAEQLIGYLTSVGVGDPNQRRHTDGWTPLFLAAIFGRVSLVASLLTAGAKADITDRDGKTAEDWAERYGQRAVVEALLHK